jgi:hypothetical protein
MNNFNLSSKIENAVHDLNNKLLNLDLHALGVSEYNIRYIASKLSNPSSNFGLYSDLLKLCFENQNDALLSKMTLVDYGGGSGLFSLLAKSLGIGTVVYNDIYDISCNDVRIIADAIGYPIDGIVCGEIDEVITYLNQNQLKVNAMCSFDVIEHIYDINSYLKKCDKIPVSDFGLRLIFGSGANGKNPIINRRLRNKHIISENIDREKKFGHKERDTLKSFLTIRKEIIKDYSKSKKVDFSEEIINMIATQTRGLRKQDIEAEVNRYIEFKIISIKPKDKTNTCDPLTGNWDEHIMDPNDLASQLRKIDFNVFVLPGYWRGSNRLHVRLIKLTLNFFIRFTGPLCFLLSPYYIIMADKKINE